MTPLLSKSQRAKWQHFARRFDIQVLHHGELKIIFAKISIYMTHLTGKWLQPLVKKWAFWNNLKIRA